ncbi:IS66 family transposase [Phreatobacter sp. AB_2022a]|uniref:IS66 family transposase n=1 Tax=Phreatobacter sp. AB_2022a TaxID=3003134 RepID=UPI003FA7E6F0
MVHVHASGRKAERPITHLVGFRGVRQLDGEAATGAARTLRVSPGSVLVACVATFLRAVRSTPAPIASRALQRIAGLYRVEAAIRGHDAAAPSERVPGKCRPIPVATGARAARDNPRWKTGRLRGGMKPGGLALRPEDKRPSGSPQPRTQSRPRWSKEQDRASRTPHQGDRRSGLSGPIHASLVEIEDGSADNLIRSRRSRRSSPQDVCQTAGCSGGHRVLPLNKASSA